MYGTDILTPQDEQSTYYFWACSRSYRQDDPRAGEEWEQAIATAFVGQDKPMIEAQAQMMKGRSFWELDPVLLKMDAGAIRCRRLLRQLVEKETQGAVPEPARFALADLRARATDAGKIVPVV
jgi:phenylpropionate dioxygenase-like ring-hydroxylating dioxygenase large terminal subunit